MLRIVPQVIPPDNEEAYRRAVEEMQRALRRAVAVQVSVGASFSDQEVALLAVANEACRLELEAALQATADAQPDRLRIDGAVYERHQAGAVAYHSLCGALHVCRATYRQTGERNGPTVVPLDLATGLIEDATPALAYRVALGYAQGPGRRAEEQIHADHRTPPSRSTLERLGKAIGTRVKQAAPRIEPLVRHEERLPDGAHAVPPRVDVKYRMACVGTVSIVDPASEALVTRRYAISGAENPADLTGRMMADIRRARDQQPRIPVGVVQDAAPELWTLIRAALTEEAHLRRWHEGVDRYHLNARLAEIPRLVEPDEPRRRQQLRRWNDAPDTDDGAIDRIA